MSKLFRYEPRVAKAIIEQLGNASALFELSADDLTAVFGPFSKHRDKILNTHLDDESDELESILSEGYSYIDICNENYPEILRQCEDAPVGLFVQSSDRLENIFSNESISVVGTRDASSYGRDWCKSIVKSLAMSEQRPTIISGLALGIDITAHATALENALPTIAVLGTGIGNIYPVEHERYAEMILSTPRSAIISEYPPSVDVSAVNFLSRNRIIAGLSRATILVESKLKGGGMSTARLASSYGREVFTVPGRTDDLRSQGCNMLLYSHIAEPVISCEDLFKMIDYKRRKDAAENTRPEYKRYYQGSMDDFRIRLTGKILLLIRSERGISIQDIADRLNIPYHEANALTRRLENDGFVDIDILQNCSINQN